MSVSVFITIDTEEDVWAEYGRTNNPVTNIAQLPKLQAIAQRYGAINTYLVNWAVADDASASATLRRMLDGGGCEIGAHCHPWHTPPFEEELSLRNSMLGNLPTPLIEQKLDNLRAKIEEKLRVTPISFRTGRWGLTENVAHALVKLGFAIDSSVTPSMDWTASEGPDFTNAPLAPYRFDPSDILQPNARGALLEVPPTIGFWQGNPRWLPRLTRHFSKGPASRFRFLGILEQLRLLNHRWLSPEQTSVEDMIRLAQRVVDSGATTLNLCFHSNSLLPGLSPFVRTDADLAELIRRITVFLEYAAGRNWQFAPLSGALALEPPR